MAYMAAVAGGPVTIGIWSKNHKKLKAMSIHVSSHQSLNELKITFIAMVIVPVLYCEIRK
jgi:hypothetical protein